LLFWEHAVIPAIMEVSKQQLGTLLKIAVTRDFHIKFSLEKGIALLILIEKMPK
jgi:hypothetical protein